MVLMELLQAETLKDRKIKQPSTFNDSFNILLMVHCWDAYKVEPFQEQERVVDQFLSSFALPSTLPVQILQYSICPIVLCHTMP